jgi:hypothetical protein
MAPIARCLERADALARFVEGAPTGFELSASAADRNPHKACLASAMDSINRIFMMIISMGADGASPVSGSGITQGLRARLQQSQARQGIVILDVIVLDRRGDPRRIQVIQQGNLQTAEMTTQRAVQEVKTWLESDHLNQELRLSEQRQLLARKDAETQRLRVEEEEKVRLRKAEISAAESALLQARLKQDVDLKRYGEEQALTRSAEINRNAHGSFLPGQAVSGAIDARFAAALTTEGLI